MKSNHVFLLLLLLISTISINCQ
jgi:hypothetical protein